MENRAAIHPDQLDSARMDLFTYGSCLTLYIEGDKYSTRIPPNEWKYYAVT